MNVRAVTKSVLKAQHPLSGADSLWFRWIQSGKKLKKWTLLSEGCADSQPNKLLEKDAIRDSKGIAFDTMLLKAQCVFLEKKLKREL